MYLFIVASRCAFSARTSGNTDIKVGSSPIVFNYYNLNTCGGYDKTTGKQKHVFLINISKQKHVCFKGINEKNTCVSKV